MESPMKKIISSVLPILMMVGLTFFVSPLQPGTNSVNAQGLDQTPTVAPSSIAGGIVSSDSSISLSQLGLTDSILYGPYDSLTVNFSTPGDWKLETGATIQLILDPTFIPGNSTTSRLASNYSGGSIGVSFNGSATYQIGLAWSGENTFTINIPDSALVPTRQDGRHELRLFLNAGTDCSDNGRSDVVVKATSRIILPHTYAAPMTNLAALPRPFYMKSTFSAIPAVVVVPDKPSASELQAALTIFAGFSRLTEGGLPLSLLEASQVTDKTLQSSNLIFIGKAAGLPQLQKIDLRAKSDGVKFSTNNASQDDGIIEMAVSPWNKSNVVLVVGGNSDAAVVKAAQATSSGSLRAGDSPDLTLVSNVTQSVENASIAEDRTLADLGYGSITLSGLGLQSTDVLFYVPAGQTAMDGSYLKLIFNNSGLLDFTRSGLTVYINGETIGSEALSKDTTSNATVQITIPPDLVKQGNNVLTIEVNLEPSDDCSLFATDNLWASFSASSSLHLPLQSASTVRNTTLDLRYYPYPYISTPTLQSMAFVLPSNDPSAWATAAIIAQDLGKRTQGSFVEFGTVFGDSIPDDVRQSKDLLVVGKASTLPIITELNKNLPAPFDPGSDIAIEKSFNVVYRLPIGTTIGYLELLEMPSQPEHSILAVLGSNADGLDMAAMALTTPNLRTKLGGDYAVVNGDQILISDSRLHVGTGNISSTVVPEQSVTQVVTNEDIQPTVVPDSHPVWMMPAILGTTGLIIITLLVLGLITIFKKKS
jgi:cellulose synthase operon protein B